MKDTCSFCRETKELIKIKHPKCKSIPFEDRFRVIELYNVEFNTLEELLDFANNLQIDTSYYRLDPNLIIKPGNEIEIYDTYRE